ncbi:type II toxin-antitoxin system RelE/ParE family toxin [Caulobacter endophyticus]|uniref:type II toxin-antitoxin system RelE/ParE family toxin n=1 Tax=Caulobacter endophyticus TaxID=2172652 RepID=UPI00240F12CC|nr:type II toxin-antitoxin system RelE/ParE family toxin [Caulobacter endophyticus]MDG2530008.1 type II toxin-antitoxin system RelE/ParE family toxin [Caulobacter endophyticus]
MRDLRSAQAWITADRPKAAATQVVRVLESATGLVAFPDQGRTGRRPGTREMVVPRTPFIIAYRVSKDRIEILRVMHGAQRWPDSF